MKHELKVILGATTAETLVFVDDKPIGLIQDIKFRASVNSLLTEIEIIFPNLFSPNIDPKYIENGTLVKDLKDHLNLLKDFPHVSVKLQDIVFEGV